MRILGVDPGLEHTGWGVIEWAGQRPRYVAHGTIVTDSRESEAARLSAIQSALTQVCLLHGVSALAAEGAYLIGKFRAETFAGLQRVLGMTLAIAGALTLPAAIYQPSECKLAASGSGRAAKMHVRQILEAMLGVGLDGDLHGTDALAVAVTHGVRGAWRADAERHKAAG